MLITYEFLISDIPQECIEDCSGPGSVDAAVNYWRKELNFQVDRKNALNCLDGYGAWDDLDTWDDNRLAETVLWLACGDFSAWDGTEDSACGSDLFVLE